MDYFFEIDVVSLNYHINLRRCVLKNRMVFVLCFVALVFIAAPALAAYFATSKPEFQDPAGLKVKGEYMSHKIFLGARYSFLDLRSTNLLRCRDGPPRVPSLFFSPLQASFPGKGKNGPKAGQRNPFVFHRVSRMRSCSGRR